MSTIILAFKHGQLLQDDSSSWIPIPHALLSPTLCHVKLLFRVRCSGSSCAWCTDSQRDSGHGQDHFVAYYGSTGTPWTYEVDIRRFNKAPHEWTYMSIPLNGDAEQARRLVHSQVGKPFNRKGYFYNYAFGRRFGITKLTSDLDFAAQPSWLCAEMVLALLSQFGYRTMFQDLVPCQMIPMQVWSECRRIPGSKVLLDNPALGAARHVDAWTVDWPPGGIHQAR